MTRNELIQQYNNLIETVSHSKYLNDKTPVIIQLALMGHGHMHCSLIQ